MDDATRPCDPTRPGLLHVGPDPHQAGREEDDVALDRWRDESGVPDAPGIDPVVGRPSGSDHLAACDEADRRGTLAACGEHRRRFVAAGGGGLKFDGLQLVKAARMRAQRILDVLTMARGAARRPATEEEVRDVLAEMAGAAETARSAGKLRAFRRLIWPFGAPPS